MRDKAIGAPWIYYLNKAVTKVLEGEAPSHAKQYLTEHAGRKLLRGWLWLCEAMYASIMLLILRPAADHLPVKWAFFLARCFGLFYTILPFYGSKKFSQIRNSLAENFNDAVQISKDWFSRPLCDFIFVRRSLQNQENFMDWPLVEINKDILGELKRTDQSYILATGHFTRQAFAPLFLERTVPQRITTITNPSIKKSLNPRSIWTRRHFGQILQGLSFVRNDVLLINPGEPNLMKTLIGRLKTPGNVVAIMVDAPWKKDRAGSFARPFAAMQKQWFATGAARIARMAQCPIVLCVPFIGTDGTIFLDWKKVIHPPEPKDAEADLQITNILLDGIEKAIGERPSQYVIDFLGKRSWDRESQRWV